MTQWTQTFALPSWSYLSISLGSWLTFAGIAVTVFFSLRWTRRLFKIRLRAIASRTPTDLDDLLLSLVNRTTATFLLILALYIGAATALPLSDRKQSVIWMVMIVTALVQTGLWAHEVIDFTLARLVRRRGGAEAGLQTAAGALNFFARVVVWSVLVLLILSNLHVDVTTLVAGLGIGGIAVALAVQNILGDLFASLSILVDQPFAVGHFIVIDDLAGTVQHVGLKTTRIRSLSGEQVVLSNADLLKTRIHNYKWLFERRVLFSFGVTYDTGHEKLSAIPSMVQQIISNIPKTRFDRAHFKEFGDSSLNFEVVYFVLDPDYNMYMDIQQQINLELYQQCGERQIDFAFPTRVLYVSTAG